MLTFRTPVLARTLRTLATRRTFFFFFTKGQCYLAVVVFVFIQIFVYVEGQTYSQIVRFLLRLHLLTQHCHGSEFWK